MKSVKNYLISIFTGISTGLLTLFIVPIEYEILVWLLLIIALGGVYSEMDQRKPFWNAFLCSLLVGCTITATHIMFLDTYIATHPSEIAMLKSYRLSYKLMITLLVIAPIYWLILGVLSGSVCLLFKGVKKIKKQCISLYTVLIG